MITLKEKKTLPFSFYIQIHRPSYHCIPIFYTPVRYIPLPMGGQSPHVSAGDPMHLPLASPFCLPHSASSLPSAHDPALLSATLKNPHFSLSTHHLSIPFHSQAHSELLTLVVATLSFITHLKKKILFSPKLLVHIVNYSTRFVEKTSNPSTLFSISFPKITTFFNF